MIKGLLEFDWNDAALFCTEDISYFLYMEGKSPSVISTIRALDISTVQQHLILGKIKYRVLVKSKDIEEFYSNIIAIDKKDRILTLENLSSKFRGRLIEYIIDEISNFSVKEKENALWLLGEMKEQRGYDLLIKASVSKFVNLRRIAISAMGKTGDLTFENALLRALEDENNQVILYSLKALIKIKSSIGTTKVKKMLESPQTDQIVRTAREYLSLFSS